MLIVFLIAGLLYKETLKSFGGTYQFAGHDEHPRQVVLHSQVEALLPDHLDWNTERSTTVNIVKIHTPIPLAEGAARRRRHHV